jgi:predicted ATP-dependent protease
MEAKKIGYKKVIMPLENARQIPPLLADKIEIIGIYNVKELLDIIMLVK